jgi:predicted enzyme related to lactoylglutathione lyase
MKVNLIVIRSEKPEELSLFYSRLGISFEYHKHGNGPYHYSANVDGLILELYPLMKSQKEIDRTLRLGFEVSGLDGIIQNLESEGIEVVSKPKVSEWGYRSVVKDIEGRRIELIEKLPTTLAT